MNISTLLYGRGAARETPRTAAKSLVSEIHKTLLDAPLEIRIFEHNPFLEAQFREIHVTSTRLDAFREYLRGSLYQASPILKIINGHCTVDEIGFGARDNAQTLRILKDRILKIAKEKASNLLTELTIHCQNVKRDFSQEPPSILDNLIRHGSRLTIENRYSTPRLGFREELPLLLLDNDHAKRIGVQGFKGIYSSKRDRFVLSDGTFFILGQGDNFNIKSVTVSMLQPRLGLAGILQDTLGEPLVVLERCYGEAAMNVGFHLKETCRAQLLAVSNKLL